MTIVLRAPPQGGKSLCDYRFLLRRLLHDPSGRMYPDEDLNAYINIARERVARDTCCIRVIQQNVTLATGIESYEVGDLPYGPQTVDVLGISVFWGNWKYQLNHVPFITLDAQLRTWVNFRQRPTFFSRHGGTTVFIGAVPDQNYPSDWDTCLIPLTMTTCEDAEQIPIPFQDPVPFFAAYYAKMYEQSFGESELFFERYQAMLKNAMITWRRRIIAKPYGSTF